MKHMYMVIDVNYYELPLYVGTLEEVSRYEGLKQKTILCNIANAKRKGKKSRYINLGTDKEMEKW